MNTWIDQSKRSTRAVLIALLLVFTLALSACGSPAATATEEPEQAAAEEPAMEEAPAEEAAAEEPERDR
jgi:hypothetical protein